MKDKAPQTESNKTKENENGYPAYPASEDMLNGHQKQIDINETDIALATDGNEEEIIIVPTSNSMLLSNDLDIPGSELDDNAEKIGNEDEENNFYSTGDTD